MKPNDKAYQEAADEIRFNSGLDLSEDVCSEIAKISVDAAYAAQFQSEDYAGLVKWLRDKAESLSEIYPPEAEAADAIEMLFAKLNNKPKPSEDYAGLIESLRQDISDPNGKLMSDWDSWRKYIASGGDSSWPRDQFEGHLDAIAEIHHSVADAIEALLAERDTVCKELIDEIKRLDRERIAWKKQQEETAALLKQVEAERDALAARLAPVDDEALVEIATREIFIERRSLAAAIAAIRPHIEAAEREWCAKRILETNWVDADPEDIAAAIRSGK